MESKTCCSTGTFLHGSLPSLDLQPPQLALAAQSWCSRTYPFKETAPQAAIKLELHSMAIVIEYI